MSLTPWYRRWQKPPPAPVPLFSGPQGESLFAQLPRKTQKVFSNLSHALDPTVNPSAYESSQQELIDQLRQLPQDTLSRDNWLIGFRQMVSNGCFRLGGVFRDQAVQVAFREAAAPNADKDSLIIGFCAAIDQGQLTAARDLLQRLHHVKKVGSATLSRLTGYLELLSGNLPAFYELNPEPTDPPDSAFLDYISGQTVALVGPAAGSTAQGPEIDTYHRIARANYRGAEAPYDPVTAGSRSDLSFYAHGNFSNMHKMGTTDRFFQWLESLDWAIFKNLDFPFQQEALKTGKVITRRWNQLFFHGHPNLTPSNLYTLLYFRAARVKVFNSNLYLSSTPYAQGYVARLNLQMMFRSMAGHDCVSQLNFMRCLFQAGVMDLDPECTAVLSLSSAEYLAGLERIFVNPEVSAPS
jgi:hypothetical protein